MVSWSLRPSLWIFAYPSGMEVSKCLYIPGTWCNNDSLNNKRMYLHFGIGRDNTTYFQPELPPFLQGRVSHLWSFCLRFVVVGHCPSLWVVHPCCMCVNTYVVTLQLILSNSSMLSRNSPISFKLCFSGIPQFSWLISTWCWVGPTKAFHSYCINGSPLLTINVMEQQVTKLATTI